MFVRESAREPFLGESPPHTQKARKRTRTPGVYRPTPPGMDLTPEEFAKADDAPARLAQQAPEHIARSLGQIQRRMRELAGGAAAPKGTENSAKVLSTEERKRVREAPRDQQLRGLAQHYERTREADKRNLERLERHGKRLKELASENEELQRGYLERLAYEDGTNVHLAALGLDTESVLGEARSAVTPPASTTAPVPTALTAPLDWQPLLQDVLAQSLQEFTGAFERRFASQVQQHAERLRNNANAVPGSGPTGTAGAGGAPAPAPGSGAVPASADAGKPGGAGAGAGEGGPASTPAGTGPTQGAGNGGSGGAGGGDAAGPA